MLYALVTLVNFAGKTALLKQWWSEIVNEKSQRSFHLFYFVCLFAEW